MPDTLANKKITFTTQQLVIIVVFVVGLLGTLFKSWHEYQLLRIEFEDLKETVSYERDRVERKFKRLENVK